VGPTRPNSDSWITTISCSRPGLCVAGGIDRSANENPFVAFEVNRRWNIDRPMPGGVSSLSCDAFGTCVISGWKPGPSQLNGHVSVVTWRGGHWSAPLAIGPLAYYASSIASCAPEREACTVVVTESTTDNSGVGSLYAATLDDHGAWSWRLILAGSNTVTGLDCTSRQVCDAVGTPSAAPQGTLLFLMRRNGRWLSPLHDGRTGIESLGPAQIACSAQDYCTAVATGTTSRSIPVTLYADLPG